MQRMTPWRAQEDITDGGDPLGEGAFGAVVPGELGGVAVAIKWAVCTDASHEALLREYSFLRSPCLRESHFIIRASPARTFADFGPMKALKSQASARFEHTVAVDPNAPHPHTTFFTRTGDLGLLWDGGQDYMPSKAP